MDAERWMWASDGEDGALTASPCTFESAVKAMDHATTEHFGEGGPMEGEGEGAWTQRGDG